MSVWFNGSDTRPPPSPLSLLIPDFYRLSAAAVLLEAFGFSLKGNDGLAVEPEHFEECLKGSSVGERRNRQAPQGLVNWTAGISDVSVAKAVGIV